jgi:hypothetical protein
LCSQTSPSLPPRARTPSPQTFSPANRTLPAGHDGGHDADSRTPFAGGASRLARRVRGRRPCPRCGSTCSRRERRQTSPLLPPNDTDPRTCGISPANWPFTGNHDGAMMAIRGPSGRRPFAANACRDRGAKAIAPVGAVLLASAKGPASIFVPKGSAEQVGQLGQNSGVTVVHERKP